MTRTPLGLAFTICLPVLVLLVGLVGWNPAKDFWKSVEPPKAQVEAYDPVRLQTEATLTSAVYDQRKLDRLVREPQNTVSNLAYIFAGGLGHRERGAKARGFQLGTGGYFPGIGERVVPRLIAAGMEDG